MKKNMMIINTFIGKVLSNYRITVVLLLLISIPFFYGFSQQRHHNDIVIYFDKNDPDMLTYKRFVKVYGNEQVAIVAFEDKDIFTNKNISLVRALSKNLLEVPGVQRVFSLTTMEEPRTVKDKIEFYKIIPPGTLTPEKLKDVRDKAVKNEVLLNSIISADSTTTSIIIEIGPLSRKARTVATTQIRTVSNRIAAGKTRLYFSGLPFGEYEMHRLSQRDFKVFIPVVFLIISVIVMILLKNLTLAFLCQINLIIAMVWSIGFYVLCGETFNIVTVILAPVILAIAIADSVHMLSQYRKSYLIPGVNHEEAVSHATRHIWLPCLLTSLTTAVGFFSFISSTIRPVRIVGIYTAIGVLFAFFLTVTLLPALVTLLKKRIVKSIEKTKSREKQKNAEGPDNFFRGLDFIANVSTTYIKGITFLFVIIMAISVWGMSFLKFETNMLEYLPDDNFFKIDTAFFEKNLGGINPMIVLIKAEGEQDFTHPESLRMLDTFQTELMQEVKLFTTSSSIADYMKQMHKSFNSDKDSFYKIPNSRDEVIEYFEMANPDLLDRYIGPGNKEVRISFQALCESNEVGNRIGRKVRAYLEKNTGNSFSFKITGRIPLYLSMEKNLKTSQIRSFLLAFVIIFIMMFFVTRSFLLAVLSMIPNLFPIVLTIGIMGLYGLPMDVSTIMIASVTIGIAVDDTIHFIVAFRRNMGTVSDPKEAIIKTFHDVGKPIVITTVILFCGFFTLILGDILPTRTFGVLAALSMLFALIADIIFLPALILLLKPKVKPLTDKKEPVL